MNKQVAKEFLFKVADIFDKHNLKFYLDYGTLLGAIREKDFLSNDSDIDLGSYDRLLDNIDLLKKLTIDFQAQGITIRNFWDNTYNSIMSLKYNNEEMDIYHKVRTDKEYVKYGNKVKIVYPLECLDTLDEITFLGRKIKVPHNAEKYLEHVYGNWRVPCGRGKTKWLHRHKVNYNWSGKLNYQFPLTIAFYVNLDKITEE